MEQDGGSFGTAEVAAVADEKIALDIKEAAITSFTEGEQFTVAEHGVRFDVSGYKKECGCPHCLSCHLF